MVVRHAHQTLDLSHQLALPGRSHVNAIVGAHRGGWGAPSVQAERSWREYLPVRVLVRTVRCAGILSASAGGSPPPRAATPSPPLPLGPALGPAAERRSHGAGTARAGSQEIPSDPSVEYVNAPGNGFFRVFPGFSGLGGTLFLVRRAFVANGGGEGLEIAPRPWRGPARASSPSRREAPRTCRPASWSSPCRRPARVSSDAARLHRQRRAR